MMRKMLAGFLAFGLGAVALAGCGSGTAQSGESGASGGSASTLKLWMPPNSQTDVSDKEGWNEILKPFEEEHNVKVDVTIIPWASYEEKFLTGAASGNGADVGYMYAEMIGDYIARDQLAPFDEYLTQEQKDSYLYLDLGAVDGVQYSIPFVVGNARVIFYNKTMLDEAGIDVPTTWDEFHAAAKKISETGKSGFLAPWGDQTRGTMNSIYFPFVWQAGGDLFNTEGTQTEFASPEGLRAAEFLNSMNEDGSIPSSATGMSGDDANELFEAGEGAFLIGGTNLYDKLGTQGVDVGVIDSLKDETEGTFVAADSLVMFDSCPDKALCADLVKFITSTDAMSQFHEWAPFPPITVDETYEGPEVFRTLYEERGDIFRTLPAIPNSTAAYNSLWVNLQQMALGQKTPEEALQTAAAEGDAALNQ